MGLAVTDGDGSSRAVRGEIGMLCDDLVCRLAKVGDSLDSKPALMLEGLFLRIEDERLTSEPIGRMLFFRVFLVLRR